jgi:hypothetical protein
VRFGELKGLTSLPVQRVRHQFRYEEVLAVLPVQDAATSRETLLVATRSRLAILVAVRVPRRHWMTRWSPWDAVTIGDQPAPPTSQPDVHQLTLTVGSRAFEARLTGETGRRAVRDFVAAVRRAQPAKPARRQP